LKQVFSKATVEVWSGFPEAFYESGMVPVSNSDGAYDLIIDIENEGLSKSLQDKQAASLGYYVYYNFRALLYELSPFEPIGYALDFRHEGAAAMRRSIFNRQASLGLNGYRIIVNAIKGFGLSSAAGEPRIDLSESDVNRGRELLRQAGLKLNGRNAKADKPIVFFDPHCGTRKGSKDWSLEEAVHFIEEFLSGNDVFLVINSGVGDEIIFSRDILKRLKISQKLSPNLVRRVWLSPQGSLKDYMCLLSAIDIGVAFDTGTAHLLSALDKPAVIIFNLGYELMSWQPLNKKSFSVAAVNSEVLSLETFLLKAPLKEGDSFEPTAWLANRIPVISFWSKGRSPVFAEGPKVAPSQAAKVLGGIVRLWSGHPMGLFKEDISRRHIKRYVENVLIKVASLSTVGYESLALKRRAEEEIFRSVDILSKTLKDPSSGVLHYDRDLVCANLEHLTVVAEVLSLSNMYKFCQTLCAEITRIENAEVKQLQALLLDRTSRSLVIAVTEALGANPFITSEELGKSLNIDQEQLLGIYRYMKDSPLVQAWLTKRAPCARYIGILGDVLGEDRGFWEAVLKGQVVAPLEVEFHPSLFCNLKCEHCYSHDVSYSDLEYAKTSHRIPLALKSQKVQSMIHEMALGGTQRIYISGGKEPLMDPLTPEIIRSAKDNGLDIILNTNGVNLDGRGVRDNGEAVREIGKILLREKELLGDEVLHFYLENVSRIRISLDFWGKDNAKFYNQSRGLNPQDVSLARLEEILHKMIPMKSSLGGTTAAIEIVMLVLKENLYDLSNIVERLKELGVDSVVIRHVNVGQGRQEANAFDGQAMNVLQQIAREYENDAALKIRINFEDFMPEAGCDRTDILKSTQCWRSLHKTVINPYGLGIACCYTAHPGHEHLWGQNFILSDRSIFSYDTFMEYWREEVVRQRREGIDASRCAGCLLPDRGLNAALDKVRKDQEWGIALFDQPFSRGNFYTLYDRTPIVRALDLLENERLSEAALRMTEERCLKDILQQELGAAFIGDTMAMNDFLHLINKDILVTAEATAIELGVSRDVLLELYRIVQLSAVLQKLFKSLYPTYMFDIQQVVNKEKSFWSAVSRGEFPLPSEVEFHTSLTCNLRCPYCPNLTIVSRSTSLRLIFFVRV
ncbi:MAG: hypothetical protein HQL15_10325, partial [Candidatus Omnitrophica bacterium]|nr:hypothetical protein [Candidatus Omnitrophota bacterium]